MKTLLLSTFLLLSPALLRAQPPVHPPAGLPAVFYRPLAGQYSSTSLAVLLQQIETHTHLSFLCDSWPRDTAQAPQMNVPLWQALNNLCYDFNCKWSLLKGASLVMFTRSVSNPAKHLLRPQTNLPEMQHMAALYAQALRAVSPNLTLAQQKALFRQAYAMLSIKQKLQCSSSQGLALAAMPPAAARQIAEVIKAQVLYPALHVWEYIDCLLRHYNTVYAAWTPEQSIINGVKGTDYNIILSDPACPSLAQPIGGASLP